MTRALIAALLTFLVAATATAQTQVFRLALLTESASSAQRTVEVTLPALDRLGFARGRNLFVDAHIGAIDELPELAQRAVAGRPDVIHTNGPYALAAARAATQTIPIVSFGPDLTLLGWARSQAQPGGNVTGIAVLGAVLDVKRVELLHRALPDARRLAVLVRGTSPGRDIIERAMQEAASSAGLDLRLFASEGPADYPAAFAAMRSAGTEGLVIVSDPVLTRDAARLIALAQEARLPTICAWSDMARAGCLLSYGPNETALRQRMASYIARIFRGAAPADMPIELPTQFELAVNLRAASALGLTMPQMIMIQVDEVIE